MYEHKLYFNARAVHNARVNIYSSPIVTLKRRNIASHPSMRWQADVKVFQTFSKFSLVLKTKTSSSVSKMAAFELSNPIKKTISYQYLNKPNSKATDTMEIHEGTTIFDINCNENKLTGYYYSGRGRKTHGDISLTRCECS